MSDLSARAILAEIARQDGSPDERRESPRFRLRDARGIMSWHVGPERVACEVEVLNISGGGAALLATGAPGPGLVLRLQMIGKSILMDPVEARLIATSADPSGRQLVRLQFTQYLSLDAILTCHYERRLWQRYPVRESHAKLTWFENGSAQSARGELLNISGGGAAIILDVNIRSEEPIWFEIEAGGDALEAVECRLVITSLDPSGSKIARIKFIDPCPMRLFELAIHGTK
jgi:PilZ domain